MIHTGLVAQNGLAAIFVFLSDEPGANLHRHVDNIRHYFCVDSCNVGAAFGESMQINHKFTVILKKVTFVILFRGKRNSG